MLPMQLVYLCAWLAGLAFLRTLDSIVDLYAVVIRRIASGIVGAWALRTGDAQFAAFLPQIIPLIFALSHGLLLAEQTAS
jgi:hypothetical protein